MNNIQMEYLQGRKILLAVLPTDCHFNPLTGLAVFLNDLGCEVRWYNPEVDAGERSPKATLIRMIEKHSQEKIY